MNSNLVLEPYLKAESIAELKTALEDRLAGSEAIEIDASKVKTISAAAMQLLLAFDKRVSNESGRQVTWLAVSDAMTATVALLGLSDYFKFDTADEQVDSDEDDLCPVF